MRTAKNELAVAVDCVACSFAGRELGKSIGGAGAAGGHSSDTVIDEVGSRDAQRQGMPLARTTSIYPEEDSMRKSVALSLAILMLAVALSPIPVAAQAGGGGITIPISGTGFVGNLVVRSFGVVDGVLTAFVTATVTNLATGITSVRRVAIPVDLTQTTASCEILHLVLGPLDLNLLGLTVHLNQVVLDIAAEPGPGNLLGNLLCAIANLLNGTSTTTTLQTLAGLLTRLLGIL